MLAGGLESIIVSVTECITSAVVGARAIGIAGVSSIVCLEITFAFF